jgi:Carboxypeptidase regulatory-like domain
MKTISLALLLLASFAFAQDGPDQKPNVFLQNDRSKNEKESNTRTIDGTVKDAGDNPLGNAIVQLKNMKTSNIVNFSTKEDGRYVFRDLPMDINFELLAKRGDLTTPVKAVSIYDTRKRVIVNFQITETKP